MIKLNDSSIEVGEIKQILKDFNLPNCVIGQKNVQVGKHYIEGNSILKCSLKTGSYKKDNDQTEEYEYYDYQAVDSYIFGKKYLNLTSNLKISNMLYDQYTHRYLGRYLRFIRDYKGVDLMSMYNCYDGEPDTLDVSFTDPNLKSTYISFDTSDEKYSIYSVPVSKHPLTIKFTADIKAEICATVNIDNDQISSDLNTLAKITYMQAQGTKPFLYNKLTTINTYNEIEAVADRTEVGHCAIDPAAAAKEYQAAEELLNRYYENIRILIKIPRSFSNSIIVLEGDYTKDYAEDATYFIYKPDPENNSEELADSGFYKKFQLFSYENETDNYLLADRLIEYITGNAISPISQDYDIRKIQKYLIRNKQKNNTDYSYVNSDYLGIWSDADTYGLRQFAYDNNLTKKYDTVGYVDKNVEEKTQNQLDAQDNEALLEQVGG